MHRQLSALVLGLLLLPLGLPLSGLAQSAAFTYQGRLLDGGQPANGSYDFQFALADALTGGNRVGPALTNAPVSVSNGLFVVVVDFGSGAFDGSARWLEIGVRTNGSAGPYTALSPRQRVTAAPYATFANTAANAAVAAGLVPGAAITANGAGITNLNGAAIQAGTINSNQLDQATAAQLALVGTPGGTSSNAIANLNGRGTNTTLYYPMLVAGTNVLQPLWTIVPPVLEQSTNLIVSGLPDPDANGVYVASSWYYDAPSGDYITNFAGPKYGIIYDDQYWLYPYQVIITNGAGSNLYYAPILQWPHPQLLCPFSGPTSNMLGAAVAWSTNHLAPGSSYASGFALSGGALTGVVAADLAGSSNYSASRLVGTVTNPVAADLSGSRNYNATRLVGTIPLANLPSAVLSNNVGVTSNIPVSAMQPLGSFSVAAIAPTPPMGICTWPAYGGASQSIVEMLADMLYTNGLVGYGWRVIQLDGGWQLPSRDSQENLAPNPSSYTNWTGMLGYLRSRGIVLGLYTEMTSCGGGVPITYGYFAQDVAQFASWGVGYLKLDYCDNSGNGDNRYVALSDFRRAMDRAGWSAYVMSGGWGDPAGSPVRAWLPTVVNSWRLGIDGDSRLFGGPAMAQGNMLLHFHHALQYGAAFTGPGHYPDVDFISTGQAVSTGYINTNTSPFRYPTVESAVGLAAICPSPIMLDTINLALMPIYTNTAMIAINQDPLVLPAQLVSSNATSEVWSRRLFNGDRAVALVNKTGASQAISVGLSTLGLPSGPTVVYSVWDRTYLPCAPTGFTSSVDPWYVQLLRFSPTQPGLFTGTVGLTSNNVPFTLHITNGQIYQVTSP